MASSQRFNNSVSNNSTGQQFSVGNNLTENNQSENQHFSPNWTSLSFLDDSNDELSEAAADFEVAKNAKVFDPVVGGRNSTRSSSSRSSGSTGCSDQALESSPTNSLSPYAFDHEQDDNTLGQVMTNFHQMSLKGDMGFEPPKQLHLHHQKSILNASNNFGQLRDSNPPTNTILHSTQHIYQQKQPCLPQQYQGQKLNPPPNLPLMHQSMNQQRSNPPNQTQFMANMAALAGVMAPGSNHMGPWTPTPPQDNLGLSNLMQSGDKPATMQIRCKFGSLGELERQFHSPHGFCMGPNEEIIVADTFNHRIQIFDKEGNFKFAFGVPGKDEGQLFYPRKVAVLRNSGYYVICDRGSERSRMQIFSPMGHFIRRIPIRFIDIVAGLAISREGYIVAVDSVTPTIFIMDPEGQLIKYIECSEYMTEPSDIAIFGNEYYICDFKGHSIVVMHENGTFLRRIGCQPVTNFPNGIDISDAGDILVGDSHGNQFHVAVYDRRGELISQFQCPQVKVSRCCGLKITSEGYIVTLAKNNHHVLILNTLYVP